MNATAATRRQRPRSPSAAGRSPPPIARRRRAPRPRCRRPGCAGRSSAATAGSLARSFFSERSSRRGGIFAARRRCAVRSRTTSWNVKRYSLRAPRPGETNPASIEPGHDAAAEAEHLFDVAQRVRCFALLLTLASGLGPAPVRRPVLPPWRRAWRPCVPSARRPRHPSRPCLATALAGFALEAGAQCIHQVDDLGAGRRLGRLDGDDLLAGDLLVDGGEDRAPSRRPRTAVGS